MSNEAFDIWLKENYLHTNPPLIEIWQAAKADSEREIAELIDELVRYKIQVQYWKDFCEKVKKIDYNDYFLLQAKNSELSASINVLREALEYHTEQTRPIQKTIDALSSTPAQSLQVHDNEVIEKCAKVCDGYTHGVWFADKIRALKGK